MMVITVIGGFPLWMEPVNETIEGHWGPCTKGRAFITNPVYIMFRIFEIIAISLVAYFVPFFGDILSLVGNFTDVVTTFIFPALMHFVVIRTGDSVTIAVLDIVAFIFSFIIMVVCTSVSVLKLIKDLNQ